MRPDIDIALIKRAAVAGMCGWEIVAITSGRVPTFTTLANRHKWLPPLLIGALSAHLYDLGIRLRGERSRS